MYKYQIAYAWREALSRVGQRSFSGCRLLVAAAVMTLTVATALYAKDDQLSFDIPAQSLASALDAYVTTTNIETFYDSELVRTRRSTGLKGILAPDVALRVLLEGTGLTEVSTGKAFAVVAAARPTQYGGVRLSEFGSYYNALQVGVARAFCRHAETIPGDYRAVIRFSVGLSGELQGLNLLNSTGDLRRDSIIADELRGVSFDAPPARLPQPVTMVVTPRAPGATGDCDAGSGRQATRSKAGRP